MIKKEHLLKHISNKSTRKGQEPYVGRFAPSPTGPLHFGSLVCALASFLHAKQHRGKWLVRIEDIDTPRIDVNMNESILDTLRTHGLIWDDEVVYQSRRHAHYEAYLGSLEKADLLYACTCSRQQVRARSGSYDGHCRDLKLSFKNVAIRFKHNTNNSKFTDLFWGERYITHSIAREDPVLKRADGIYAYHLAAVVDDIEQQVSHIVRGNDLLETSPVHLSLFQAFQATAPHYLHIPIVVQKPNEKLSKQHGSPAVDNNYPIDNLKLALQYLGLSSEKQPIFLNIEQLLDWAVTNWSFKLLPKQSELLISVANDVYSSSENMLAVDHAK